MAASSKSRFAVLDEAEIGKILSDKDSENTKKSTKGAVGLFRAYLAEKKLPTDFETLDKSELAAVLSKFYLEARKTDGQFYKTTSLNAIRAGLNRHLKDVYPGLIDIIKDTEFSNANVSYRAATVQLKKAGKGDIVHHQSVDKNDIEKLYTSGVFNQNTPAGLQQKVWFELMIYICRRGRENLRDLKKNHFTVQTDSDGRQYVAQAIDELTKKTREDNQSSRKDAGRMYETRDENCPVASFKKYVSKLNPECDAFFQTPRSTVDPSSAGPWYKNCPLGKNSLGNMMVHLSKTAKLSKLYTNHCLRATCISILDVSGFAAREICQVSGHANEGSLSSYTGKVSDVRKQKISDALSHALGKGQTSKPSVSRKRRHQTSTSTAPATVSRAPEAEEERENDTVEPEEEPNFDLGFTLTSSQEVTVHELEEILEVHSQGDNPVLAPIDMNANDAVARASDTRVSSTTTSTTHTMQPVDYEMMAGEGGSLDHEVCQQMASLVESLTTSGKPSLDQDTMKQLKKICKLSDAYVEHCFQLVISQLEEEHAEIRLSAFQVINELFSRSHRFRELLVADMQEYLELTVGTNVDLPLPPPKPAAILLKEHALRAMQEWYNKFGKAYKKLGLGYTYLKNSKKVDFVNIQARSDAERQRAEERQRRLQQAQQQKLNKVTEEMNEIVPEIQECLTQCENCFQLLLPNMTFNDLSDVSMAEHSSQSTRKDKTKPLPKGKHHKRKPVKESKQSEKDIDADRTKEGLSRYSETCQKVVHEPDRSLGENSSALTSGRSIFDIGDEDEDKLKRDEPSSVLGEGKSDGRTKGGEKGCRGLSSQDGDGQMLEVERSKHVLETDGTSNTDEEDGEQNRKSGDEEGDSDEESNGMEEFVGVERRSLLQQHGLPSWTSININIDVGTEGVKIKEDEDNTDVLQSLDDQQRLLATRYLTKLNGWIETLTKMGKSDKVQQLIDIKREIQAKQEKYKELQVSRTLSQREKTSGKGSRGKDNPGCSGVKDPRGGGKGKDVDSDDEDDDGFEEVPEKEGYEPDIPAELREEYGLDPLPKPSASQETAIDWHPIRDADNDILDPASQAGSIAAMKEKLKKIREEAKLPPGYHVIPAKKTKPLTEEESKRQELLKRAPVVPFGTDLAYWKNPEDIQAPVVLRPDTDARTWIGAVDDEEVVLESAKDSLKTRVMSFTGSFQPVKWKCRAPLPNGQLCERMDRQKCPFHGKIIARDELGNPQDGSLSVKKEEEETAQTGTSAWRDPELLKDIECATGLNLGSASTSSSSATSSQKGKGGKGKGSGKKGKGKAKKYPGLTDIRKINNTSRNRLEKIVMNRGAVKRVAAALNRVDQKRYMDKFGNNFNYAL